MEKKNPPVGALILTVIAAGLLCRLAFVFFTPVFYAPDEQAHFNYIKHLAEDRTFPVTTGRLDEAANGSEFHQPPLYYLLMVPVFDAARAAALNLDATVRLLRVFSILLWLLNMWFGIVLLKRLQVKDGFVWIFVVAMVSLLPTYTFVSSAINNDNLLATLSSGLLCLMVQRIPTLKHSILLGLALGLALLTKKSAFVFVPAIALIPVRDCLCRRVGWPSGLAHLGVAFGIASLMYVPWALWDWHIYNSLNPELLAPNKIWPSTIYGIASAIHNLLKTFWAVSGISNNVGYPFPLPGMLLLLLCGLTFPCFWKAKQEQEALFGETARPILCIFLFLVLVTTVLALRFGYLFGMGQGRHLFPALFPIALLLAARLRMFPVKNLALYAAGFWIAYAISFVAFSLCRFP